MSTENKPKRVVVSYANLSPELQEELKKKYPTGYTESMIRIEKGPNDFFYGVVLDHGDTSYLVKVDVKVDGNLDEEEDKEYFDDDIKGADDLSDNGSEDEEED